MNLLHSLSRLTYRDYELDCTSEYLRSRRNMELKMNDSKQWKVSIRPPRLLIFYWLCLSFLTACDQDSASNDDTNPTVDLGPDLTVDVGESVHLYPTIKNLDTDTLSYLWIQTSGNPISLPDNNSSYIAFTPLVNDLLEFELTVTDNQEQ